MQNDSKAATGEQMHQWAQELFPMPRSLTGDGVRATLSYLKGILPALDVREVPSKKSVFDWKVPPEWRVRDAYIVGPSGKRFADWRVNNLHLVGYSTPVDCVLNRHDLDAHLYSLEAHPGAIPYVTSYYEERWGFCISDYERRSLPEGDYHVVIDTDHFDGHLTYADLVVEGESDHEIVLSTYVCHPSMANNELSGIVVVAALAQWILANPGNWYTYRFVFAPETIGSLCYLETNLEHLKAHVRAGWIVSCVGDEGTYSLIASRTPNGIAERILSRALKSLGHSETRFSWLDRGSDERQWCAPGIDLPICGFSRSKYGTFPEYHTSLDDLTFVTPRGLEQSLEVLKMCVLELEERPRFRVTTLGEPQMGRRGLYPTLSNQSDGTDGSSRKATIERRIMNVLSYCDGEKDSVEIGNLLGMTPDQVEGVIASLAEVGLVSRA